MRVEVYGLMGLHVLTLNTSVEEVGETQLRCPMPQIGRIELSPLGFEDPQDVVPLPIGNPAALPVPVKLVQDDILWATEVERHRIGFGADRFALPARQLGPGPRKSRWHEHVDFVKSPEVDHVKGGLLPYSLTDHLSVDVELLLQGLDQRSHVFLPEVCHQIHVLRAAGDAKLRAGQ